MHNRNEINNNKINDFINKMTIVRNGRDYIIAIAIKYYDVLYVHSSLSNSEAKSRRKRLIQRGSFFFYPDRNMSWIVWEVLFIPPSQKVRYIVPS